MCRQITGRSNGTKARSWRRPKVQGRICGQVSHYYDFIWPDTRAALEAAADAHGRSLSQEVEFRLRASLQKPTSAQRRNEALAHTVALLAEVIEQDTARSWLDDPFTGLALRHAVQLVAYHFASMSTGAPEIPTAITEAAFKMPPDFAERYRTPEGFGSLKAFGLINEIDMRRYRRKYRMSGVCRYSSQRLKQCWGKWAGISD